MEISQSKPNKVTINWAKLCPMHMQESESRSYDVDQSEPTPRLKESDGSSSGKYDAYLSIAYTQPKTTQQEEISNQDENNSKDPHEKSFDLTPVFSYIPDWVCELQHFYPKKGWITVYKGGGTECTITKLFTDRTNVFRLKVQKNNESNGVWQEVQVNTLPGYRIDRIDAVTEDGLSPLLASALRGTKDCLAVLLESGAGTQVSTGGPMILPLHVAGYKGDPGITERLDAGGASWTDPDRSGKTACYYAILGLQVGTLKEALKVNPDLSSTEPLFVALVWGVVFNKWSYGNKKNTKALTIEQEIQTTEDILKILEDSGSSINQQDKNGNTALHIAVILDQKKMVSKLLSHGSDVNIANNSGYTPKYLASVNHIKLPNNLL